MKYRLVQVIGNDAIVRDVESDEDKYTVLDRVFPDKPVGEVYIGRVDGRRDVFCKKVVENPHRWRIAGVDF